MNTLELRRSLGILSCKNNVFSAVLAANELPLRVKKKPCFFIVNTDNNTQKGQHWVVFYFPLKGNPEFFDSLGNSPYHYNKKFQYILIREGKRYKYFSSRLQNKGSKYCGYYCLYYILARCNGVKYEDVFKNFSNNLYINDMIIRKKIGRYV